MTDCPRVELAPGYSISTVINGCWQLTPDHGGGPATEAASFRRFDELVESGMTTFDCADIYTGVEEMLGKYMRSRKAGRDIQVHTKYAPNVGGLHDLDNRKIDLAIDRSLRKLGVEQIDLLQFHWWQYQAPGLQNLCERLARAQRAGKIRLLGVTNFNTEKVREIIDTGVSVVSVQAQYSLIDLRPEKQMAGLSQQHGIRLLPYGVLAGGFLSERYLDCPPPADMNRSLQKYRLIIDEIGGWDVFQRLLRTIAAVAKRHQTNVATIAARWVLDQPGVAAIIVGIGTRSRAKENRALATLRLDDDDRQAILEQLQSQAVPSGDMYDLERDPDRAHTRILRMNLNEAPDRR